MKTAMLACLAVALAAPQGREGLRQALKDDLSGPWVYDDFNAGIALAKKSSKPLLAVLR